jgi:hypothetical protein
MTYRIDYIPLAIFLTLGYWGDAENIAQWQLAWKAGGVAAFVVFLSQRSGFASADRIFLGANIYLFLGGLLAWLAMGRELSVYGGLLRGVSLFGIMFLVGVISTVFSRRGYLNIDTSSHLLVLYSWILVGITLVAAAVSWTFREHRLLEGTAPFLLVYLSGILLSRLIQYRMK